MQFSKSGFLCLLIVLPFSGCGRDKNPVDGGKIPEPEGWRLVWNDEFDAPSIDAEKWNFEIGTGRNGWGNNELQYYTDRPVNAFIEDGKLIIQALKESYEGSEYTSSRMNTRGKGDWKYGRFDIRAKMPFGRGIWPAIWMMPTESVYGGWAASGEIDIMEYLGHETNKVHGTLHYGGGWPHNVHTGSPFTLPSGSFAADFYTFTLEWEPGEMRWYVDGVQFAGQTSDTWYTTNPLGDLSETGDAPFDQNFHLILNVAVGGNWPGSPDALTTFPQRMEVDYVRVFEKKE